MRLFNTMTQTVEELETLVKNKASMYTCGLTVYNQPHIGNWVAYIYWDILQRSLEREGYEVKRVQNITDVGHLISDDDEGEDKLQKGANSEGVTAWEIAQKYSKIAEVQAYDELKLLKPNYMPKATDYISQQISFVKALEEKGFTYLIDDGVYFDTSKISNYGNLAKLDVAGLKPGARVADTGKKNPTDFALWKLSPKGSKRDMEWKSPWGLGFPGWHLECSTMALELLGEQIDIHTGGIDHIPIHHTNEIAQTEALTGKPFSQFWVHANHMKVNGTKMSKSIGNVYTLDDIKDKGFQPMSFKLLVLSKHYRTEGNFTWEILESADNRLRNWKNMFNRRWQLEVLANEMPDISNEIIKNLKNDLDTPAVLAEIDKYFDEVDKAHSMPNRDSLLTIRDLLGLDLLEDDINEEQKSYIKEREKARDNNDWSRSDELRDILKAQGIEVKDTHQGTIWTRI